MDYRGQILEQYWFFYILPYVKRLGEHFADKKNITSLFTGKKSDIDLEV